MENGRKRDGEREKEEEEEDYYDYSYLGENRRERNTTAAKQAEQVGSPQMQ